MSVPTTTMFFDDEEGEHVRAVLKSADLTRVVFGFLDAEDLVGNTRLVCKFWAALCLEEDVWAKVAGRYNKRDGYGPVELPQEVKEGGGDPFLHLLKLRFASNVRVRLFCASGKKDATGKSVCSQELTSPTDPPAISFWPEWDRVCFKGNDFDQGTIQPIPATWDFPSEATLDEDLPGTFSSSWGSGTPMRRCVSCKFKQDPLKMRCVRVVYECRVPGLVSTLQWLVQRELERREIFGADDDDDDDD